MISDQPTKIRIIYFHIYITVLHICSKRNCRPYLGAQLADAETVVVADCAHSAPVASDSVAVACAAVARAVVPEA